MKLFLQLRVSVALKYVCILRGKEWCLKSPGKNTKKCIKVISRADKLRGERLRGESSADMITVYKYCQHDSRDEQKEEYLLSDGKQASGRAVIPATERWRGSPGAGARQLGRREIKVLWDDSGDICNMQVVRSAGDPCCPRLPWRSCVDQEVQVHRRGPSGVHSIPGEERHLLSHRRCGRAAFGA